MAGENNLDNDRGDTNTPNTPFNQEIGDDFINNEIENKPLNANKRSIREKITATLIVVVGLTAVFSGYLTVAKIKKPSWLGFNSPVVEELNIPSDFESETDLKEKLAEILALQNKDTDLDGLSDYQELSDYSTSPYLEDTDGDGYKDKEEIEAGHDPNCPGRDDCFSGGAAASSGGQLAPTFNVAPPAGNISDQALAGQLTAAELRQLLLEGGIEPETLLAVSDEDLMVMYRDLVGGDATSGQTSDASSSQAPDGDIASIDDLKNLSGEQIRELLIQRGAPEDQLQGISDEQLKAFFLQQLEEELNNQTKNSTNSQP